jgi:hypothetical protein
MQLLQNQADLVTTNAINGGFMLHRGGRSAQAGER